MDFDPSSPRRGAYGLCVHGAPGADGLAAAPADWPEVEILRCRGVLPAGANRIDGGRAHFTFADGGGLEVTAADRRAVFTTPVPLPDASLLHPYLAPVGAAFAWWAGRECLHAGAVVVGGRAWGVIGDKGQGKSSLLAWLALHDHPVLSDDLVVTGGPTVLAGPRCVDLRPAAARRLGAGTRTLRTPVRWRVPLGPVEPSVPLAGWFFLAWGRAVELVRLSAADVLRRLAAGRSMSVAPRDPTVLLDLAARPAWELRRPRDWDRMADVTARLVEAAQA